MVKYGVVFFYWSKTFEKTGFRQKLNSGTIQLFFGQKLIFSVLMTFTFSNACAIPINLATNELLKKLC